jgi:hypothetical protein
LKISFHLDLALVENYPSHQLSLVLKFPATIHKHPRFAKDKIIFNTSFFSTILFRRVISGFVDNL